MLFENVFNRIFGSVELKNTYVVVVLACEQVTTVRKDDLAAVFDITNGLVAREMLLEDVHHPYAVSETNYDVKA